MALSPGEPGAVVWCVRKGGDVGWVGAGGAERIREERMAAACGRMRAHASAGRRSMRHAKSADTYVGRGCAPRALARRRRTGGPAARSAAGLTH